MSGANYWLQQPTWFINSASGNDEATGIDSAHPIKTNAELQRRWGMINGNCAKLPQSTVVTIMGDMPDDDVMQFHNMFAENADLDIVGTPTVIASGTFTAVSPINRATQTMQTVTDTGLAGGWAAHVGIHMIRIVGGPRAGSTAWVAKDLGSSTCRTSRFVRTEIDAFYPTSLAPQVGDTYQILQPTRVTAGDIRVQGYNDTLAGGPDQDVKHTTLIDLFLHTSIENVQINGGGTGFVKLCNVRYDAMRTGGVLLNMQGCVLYDSIGVADRGFRVFGNAYLLACCFLNGVLGGGGGFIASNGYIFVDMDTLYQGIASINIEGFADMGTVALFDTIGSGVFVNAPSASVVTRAGHDGVDLLWGGNVGGSGPAITVAGGGIVSYTTKPTANSGLGLGREVRLNGVNLLWADVPASDLSSGAVVGVRVP